LNGSISPQNFRLSSKEFLRLLPDGRLASTTQKDVSLEILKRQRQTDGSVAVKKLSLACPAAGTFVGNSN